MKFSKFISYFFHPINFSIIGAFLYFVFLPKFIFKPQEHLILAVVFISTYVFPLILLFLMKHFKMIQSYHMITVEERKFPTILFISISFFVGIHLYKTQIVNILSLFFIGYGLCLVGAYIFLYFKQKISLHTAAVGGLIGFLIYYSYFFELNLIYLIAFFFLLSGVIASARLKLGAHSLREVIIGFLIGFGTQLIVFFAYSI
jgi:membrane-associated phospholipid phosphatase